MSATEIIPGEGINRTLMLGNSLYDTISRLKALNQPLKIAYAGQKYLEMPILVTLPKLGVRLMFESSGNQQLVLIEVLSFDYLKLTYNGDLLNDIIYTTPSSEELSTSPSLDDSLLDRKQVLPPNLKEIYNKIFGPTYPGKLNLDKKTYVLNYPGIAFKFRLELRDLMGKLAALSDENDILSKLTNWDHAQDVPCDSVAIFRGEDYDSFCKNLLEGAHSKQVHPPHTSQLSIEKVSVNLEAGTASLKFVSESETPPSTITIGKTTQQDILRLLGPPDAYFNKFDSRLLIHKHLKSVNPEDSNSGLVHKFHNYFRHGLDFLYNLNPPQHGGGVLEKIIIHNGGIAESLDFMQWNKCNWEVVAHKDGHAVKVDSSMYFNQFSDEFLDAIRHDKAGPVLLNTNESEITNDDDLEIIPVHGLDRQVIFDQSSSELVNSVPSNEFKTWGQLKLYGHNRCIWEVIETNSCVSSVTIY